MYGVGVSWSAVYGSSEGVGQRQQWQGSRRPCIERWTAEEVAEEAVEEEKRRRRRRRRERTRRRKRRRRRLRRRLARDRRTTAATLP